MLRVEHGMCCWSFGDELRGMQLQHLTLTGTPAIFSDASSARGTTKRSGVERIKHVDTRHLRSQESLRKMACSGST